MGAALASLESRREMLVALRRKIPKAMEIPFPIRRQTSGDSLSSRQKPLLRGGIASGEIAQSEQESPTSCNLSFTRGTKLCYGGARK